MTARSASTSDANIVIFNLATFTMSSFLLICFLLFLILIQMVQRMKFVRGFKHIPGPTSIPIFGNALQLTGSQAEFFKLLRQYSIKYTTMFRLWVGQRPFIFLHKAEAIQPLLNSSEHIEKSLEYKLLYPFLGTGLVTSSGDKWHAQRKLLTPVFHYNMLESYLQPIVKESNIMVKQLEKEVGNGSFDIVPYAKLAALDIICQLTMGYELNSQTKSNLQYTRAIEEYVAIQQRRFITPWLKPDVLFNCSSYANRQQKCLEVVNTFAAKIIREKREQYLNSTRNKESSENPSGHYVQRKPAKVFLDVLFELMSNGISSPDKEIRDQVNTFIFAGHDTTSTSVSWCLYVLGLHPEAQDKILSELNSNLPDFGNAHLKTSDILNLTYLECCIKEVLRLYPPVPLIGRHTTKSLNIMGQEIPSGASVLVNVYSLHRDPSNFSNPDAFIPERFLMEESTSRNPFCYVPFSAGPRNCIGQKLALQSIKIILASIIKAYKVKTIEREDNLKLVTEIVLLNENGIKIAIEKR